MTPKLADRDDTLVTFTLRPGASPMRQAVDLRWALAVVLTGLGAYLGAAWLAPAPVHHDLAWTWIAQTAEVAFLGFACIGAVALLQGRPALGFSLTAGAAWIMLAVVIGCPVTGHHGFGAWWGGQLALALGFTVAATTAALVHRPHPRPPAPPAGPRPAEPTRS
jgi:hypothetical protein